MQVFTIFAIISVALFSSRLVFGNLLDRFFENQTHSEIFSPIVNHQRRLVEHGILSGLADRIRHNRGKFKDEQTKFKVKRIAAGSSYEDQTMERGTKTKNNNNNRSNNTRERIRPNNTKNIKENKDDSKMVQSKTTNKVKTFSTDNTTAIPNVQFGLGDGFGRHTR
ncbi:hypothetical protein BLOT_003289 [Blomia tropicalis]|nr:hypothetical protein BLOT_003289 [Blomia tropicalis]